MQTKQATAQSDDAFGPVHKEQAAAWFRTLRDRICTAFEDIDGEGKFERKPWTRNAGGGGEISLMKGRVFEKVGVNISTVHGHFTEAFAAQIPGANENGGQFWASGISLVGHMRSPHVPAIHMNTRMIVTSKGWFGGGMDLTPMFPEAHAQDGETFHAAIKTCCDRHDETYYPRFKQWCDEYFYLPHRHEPRGLGGIFYDGLNTGNWDADFAFTKDVGETFLTAYLPAIRRNMDRPWTAEERERQLYRRGRYVEFNLLYDRGTTFGLKTGGNTEAILMSLPPEVKWA